MHTHTHTVKIHYMTYTHTHTNIYTHLQLLVTHTPYVKLNISILCKKKLPTTFNVFVIYVFTTRTVIQQLIFHLLVGGADQGADLGAGAAGHS